MTAVAALSGCDDGSGGRTVDVELTERAAARADRAPEIQSRPTDESNRERIFEWEELADLVDDAEAEDRRLDAEVVADAWLDRADGVEPVTGFVDATLADPELEQATADRYVMTVSVASAVSDAARAELVELFERSDSVGDFEAWLNRDSTGALIVKTGLRALDVEGG